MNPPEVKPNLLATQPGSEGIAFIKVPDHELIRPIGTGSYGDVWLARNALGSYRAVKIVYRKRFAHERPFEREFNGIQKFEPISRTQEGLVHVLQVGRHNDAGYFYYVMELADDAGGNPKSECRRPKETRNPKIERADGEPLQTSDFGPRTSDLYVPRTLAYDLKQCGRLPFEECLRIGLALTSALAHLHKHGLVHRDIKPSNIIFVGGAPKLADIGLVADAADAPSYVGTEGFIPPEGPGSLQADIYSLGKVLYEIATGKDRHDYPELPTNLDETERQPELIELNEIILTACRADPRSRYRSAEQMHADLVLLQGGRSIKQVHRLQRRLALATRIGIATGAAALLALGGYIGSIKQIQRARRAEAAAAANARNAETQTTKSKQVAQYLKEVLQDLGPSVALVRDPAMVRAILDRAAERIARDLASQPEAAIELRETLAAIYGELGVFDKMEELARKNLGLARITFGDESQAAGNALNQLGEAKMFRDKQEEAEAFICEALRIRKKLMGNDNLDVARSLRRLGNVLYKRKRLTEAEAAYHQGLAVCDRLAGPRTLVEADLLDGLAVALRDRRPSEAEASSRQSLEIKRRLLGEHPSVGEALIVYGLVLLDNRRLAEAEVVYRQAVAMNQKILGKDHYLVGNALTGLGRTLSDAGRLVDGEKLLRDAVATLRIALGNEHMDLAYALHDLGLAFEREEKWAEAADSYRESMAIRKKLSSPYFPINLVTVLRKDGNLQEATAVLHDELVEFRRDVDRNERPGGQNLLGWVLATWPDSQIRDGHAAVGYAEKAVGATGHTNAAYLDTLAAAYAESNDFEKAVSVQKEAIALPHSEAEKQDYSSRLKLYQSDLAYREPK